MSTKNIFVAVFASTIALSSFAPYSSTLLINQTKMETLRSERNSISFKRADKSSVQFNKAFEEIPKTMELWVKLDPLLNERQVLLGNFVDKKNCFSIELTKDRQLRYVEYAHQGTTRISKVDMKTAEAFDSTGEWIHIGIIRDVEQNKVTFTKNGEIALENSLDGTDINKLLDQVPLDTPHYIGTDARKTNYANAEVSEIRFWGKTKTVSEVKTSMDTIIKGDEQNLSHAWSLDTSALSASSPVIQDKKQNGINGTVTNVELPDAPSYDKSGIDFSDNKKDLETIKTIETVPMTFEAWVKFDPSKKGTRSVIAGNYHMAVYKEIPLMNFEITANGEPRMYWVNHKDVQTNYVATGTDVYNGDWTHVAISWTDTEDTGIKKFTTYINGEEVHTDTKEFAPTKMTQPFKIGEDTRKAHYMKGSLSDLRLWSNTRSAEEIKANYNSNLTGKEQGLMGNWLFDKQEPDGSYLDRSSNKNHVSSYWHDGDLFKTKEDGYSSIAVIPDSQWLVYGKPGNYTKQMTWLKNNTERLGIEFAIHVGDIVDSNSNNKQWENAKKSMDVLDGTLPYVFSGGNHDIDVIKDSNGIKHGTRNADQMNKYFPYSKFSKQEGFGGAYEEGKMDNTYSYFTAGGVEFMTISLEPFPRDAVLDWANDIVAQNPDKRVLVTTHVYMYYDGKPTTETAEHNLVFDDGANTGQQIWDEFASKHENIIAVISGHVGYPDLIMNDAIGENGNTVKQILCDAQFMDKDDGENGSGQGLGMIMLLSFKEGSEDVSINWYSTVRNKFFRQSNQFTSELDLIVENAEEKTALLTAINEADQQLETTKYKQAIPNARSMYDTKLKEAKAIYKSSSSTKEALTLALKNLKDAEVLLDQQMGDKTELKKTLQLYQSFSLDTFLDGDEKTAFIAALATLEQVNLDENAVQENIDQSRTAMIQAANTLINANDKHLLQQLLQSVEAYQASDFAIGWDAFLDAKTHAEEAIKQQSGYAEAKEKLSASIATLKRKANVTQLEKAITEAQKLDASLYASSSMKELMALVEEAKTLLSSPTLSIDAQSQVDALASKLSMKYQEVLSSKPEDPSQDKDEESTTSKLPLTAINKGKTPTSSTPDTSDTTALPALSFLAILSGGIALGIFKRRNKKQNNL